MGKKSKPLTTEEEKLNPDMINFDKLERSASSVADTVGESRDVEEVRHISDVLSTPIIITGFKRLKGDLGEYYFVYAFEPGEKKEFGFCCGGAVVMEKLNMIKDSEKMPVKATIEKVKDKYYDIR